MQKNDRFLQLRIGSPLIIWALGLLTLLAPATRTRAQSIDPNPLQLTRDHVTLSVADLKGEARWYERVLGFRQARPVPCLATCEELIVGDPDFRFILRWQKGSIRPPSMPALYHQGYVHLVFMTPAIDRDYEWLTWQGVKVDAVRDSHSNALTHMTLRDPEDNEIEINAVDATPDAVESVPANSLKLTARHFALSVADEDQEFNWYQRVLGFHQAGQFARPPDFESRMLDIPGFRIAIQKQQGSSRPPARPPFFQQGYVAIGYRTGTIDADYDRLTREGLNVHVTRDSKSNALTELTFFDPEGNLVEIDSLP